MSSLADFPPGIVAELAISTFPGNLNLASAVALIYWDVLLNLDKEKTPESCQRPVWFNAIFTTDESDSLITIDIDAKPPSLCILHEKQDRSLFNGVSIINLVFAILTGTEYQSQRTTILAELFPGIIDECVTSTIPKFESAVLLTEVIFQTLLFAMVLGRFIYLQVEAWKVGRGTNHLYMVFLRDATAVLVKQEDPQALPLEYYIVSCLGIIPPRILLNLKEVGAMNVTHTNGFIHTSTTISFAAPRKEPNPQTDTIQATYPMEVLPRERGVPSTFIELEDV
ncbi:hypothetical protein Clacol_007066 [Clathrus columnatus]|uniref:Uncharacterized protein n=1 Tax=Clathrus columnatus TaxID=1419009 RepID=A0AAV5AIR3_9AGAM|nr:hypothetical protein Clacol_007066 [Clathrus columnatus]